MAWRFSRSLLACLALAALACRVAAAQPAAEDGDAPGVFDYYLMSFTIAPSFCALSSRNAEKQECRDATDAAYREMPLTVHGLWPNRERVSVNLQPQYCAAGPLGRLPSALRTQLARYMPGVADGLDRYEWRRHGGCSGLAPAAYFGRIVALATRADATIGAALREGGLLGRELRLDDLLAAVAAKDPALAPALVMSCRFSRRQGEAESRAYVAEIRLVLTKDFTPEPAERVGMGQNSGCPNRTGFLPGGFAGSG